MQLDLKENLTIDLEAITLLEVREREVVIIKEEVHLHLAIEAEAIIEVLQQEVQDLVQDHLEDLAHLDQVLDEEVDKL